MKIDEYITSLRKNHHIILSGNEGELKIKAPKGALTEEILAGIKSRKAEILDFFSHSSPEKEAIPRAAVKAYYRLTSAQKRLFFLHEFDRDALSYNNPFAVRLTGNIIIEKLHSIFLQLISRHESLRTYFDVADGEPVQKIAYTVAFDIELYEAGLTDVAALTNRFVRPFDLKKVPLIRVGLVKISPHEHILLVDIHHIIADGISESVLINDFMALYNGEELPALSLQYKDYAEWQQGDGHQAKLKRKKDFWIKEFVNPVARPALPFDFPRPVVRNSNGDSVRFYLEEEQTKSLQELAAREGVTMFMMMLSLYAVLLSRLCNQEDIVIGTVVAGRTHADLEKLIGIFINILPMRYYPQGDICFPDFLAAVKSTALACFENQDYPYEELIDELKVERDTSHNPLFDVAFAFQNYEEATLAIPGLTLSLFNMSNAVSKFDLTLEVVQSNDQLQLHFEYATALFKRETIERFAGYFREIIAAVIKNTGAALAAIVMLPEEESNRIVTAFNDTTVPYAKEETIVSLFEKQVTAIPNQVALVYEGSALTYKELHECSNRVARLLRQQHHAGPGKVIGIIAERSEQMVIGLLGILKSGAAYLPIDPAYPAERINYMLMDSGAITLLVCGTIPHDIAFNGIVLNISDSTTYGEDDLHSINKPDDLCYLIYTSGSTGNPKGVMITHYNVVNFFAAMNSHIEVKQDDCLLAVTSTSFDISVLELFWTLCNGIQVVIHPSDISLSSLDRYVVGQDTPVDFSLFFFSSYINDSGNKYNLLMESVKYADQSGFKAVWTPERHFHQFGGLYPNPSVISAALASVTKNIQLRCGSIVSPLHDPLRIAEEWSVVDNISGGRAGLSFASGWNPDDFALNRENYASRQKTMYEQINTVRQLWKGESINRVNGLGQEKSLRIFPIPVQKEIPVWITSSGSAETFKNAGALGVNILTHLLGQDIEELAGKIKIYREARIANGYSSTGVVTVMVHTFIGEDIIAVEQLVEKPFIEYLKSAIGLNKLLMEEAGVSEADMEQGKINDVLYSAFKRYYKTSSMIGTRASCSEMISKLKDIGVNEIACLIDFGVEETKVLEGLKNLNALKELFSGRAHHLQRPVTMLQSTPSFLKLAMEGDSSKKFLQSLNILLVGGEQVPLSLVKKLQTATTAQLYNMYGPTETTIWSCVHKFETEPEKIYVGKPVSNTQVYILNKRMEPVPAGVAGDLYIGGNGVSMGYWQREALTKERFVASPFIPGSRLYKTGDIARWHIDGVIELIGREDNQVKIRGYRIELGEIETCINAFTPIRTVAVAANKKGDDHLLVAYYVADKLIDTKILRNFLGERLPEYMVPSFFVQLENMPLTPNGKLDIKNLPDPERIIDEDYVPPSTEMEEKLVEIWAEVLKTDKAFISVRKSFFEMGGHSLKATLLINKMNQYFDLEIPLNEIFKKQHIEGLADYLTTIMQLKYGVEDNKNAFEIAL